MDSFKQFNEYYKTITNAELLEILEHPNDYQPLALEASKNEFNNRNLSETDIAQAKKSLLQKQSDERSRKEKIRIFENKAKILALDFAEMARPTNIPIRTTDKVIKSVSLVYAVIFIFRLISDLRDTFQYFERFSAENILYLEPLLILLLAVFFFWQKVTIGWRLLMFFIIYEMIGHIWMLYQLFKMKATYMQDVSQFLPKLRLETILIPLFFLGATIYVISRPNIMEVFKIDKKKMINTIVFSILLSLLIMLFL